MDQYGFKLLSFLYLPLFCCHFALNWGAVQSHTTLTRKNLTCYFCHTLTHGDLCQQPYYNVQMVTTDLPFRQCARDDKHCIVRRHSYALNNSDVKVWMMERDCSKSCINECVISWITGDKMKLHLCTSCCQSNLCNVGNSSTAIINVLVIRPVIYGLLVLFVLAECSKNLPWT